MRSVLLRVFGGIAVVAISFFATMQILDWLTPQDPNASVIHVVDATYGLACKNFVLPSGQPNLVKDGNATALLIGACDNAKTTCIFTVDAAQTQRSGQRLRQGLYRHLALRQRPECP